MCELQPFFNATSLIEDGVYLMEEFASMKQFAMTKALEQSEALQDIQLDGKSAEANELDTSTIPQLEDSRKRIVALQNQIAITDALTNEENELRLIGDNIRLLKRVVWNSIVTAHPELPEKSYAQFMLLTRQKRSALREALLINGISKADFELLNGTPRERNKQFHHSEREPADLVADLLTIASPRYQPQKEALLRYGSKMAAVTIKSTW